MSIILNEKLLEDSGDQPHLLSITTPTVYKIVEEFSAQEEISEYDCCQNKTLIRVRYSKETI